nr:box C/D snoRNA protein 1 [Onthophagus taurus]
MEIDISHGTNREQLECLPSTSTGSSKLGNCEVCSIIEAKYTCPRCEVKTCSLKCANIHKKELECDGSRDRTKFIPLNKFSDLDLANDYRLLEEISRSLEGYKKDKTRRFLQRNIVLPHHLYKLKNGAQRRQITLKFLPPNFVRHKQNTTRLNYAKDTIFWRIDWIFPNSNNLKLVDEKVRETEKLSNILQKYFVKQDNLILQEKLQYYQSLGMSNIKVYLRAEQKPGNKFYELDLNESIKENLKGKVIIEYPTVIVLNKEHKEVEVIDSDDDHEDIDEKSVSGKVVIERMLKRQESEESLYNSLKNLLFVSENSNDEMDE